MELETLSNSAAAMSLEQDLSLLSLVAIRACPRRMQIISTLSFVTPVLKDIEYLT